MARSHPDEDRVRRVGPYSLRSSANPVTSLREVRQRAHDGVSSPGRRGDLIGSFSAFWTARANAGTKGPRGPPGWCPTPSCRYSSFP